MKKKMKIKHNKRLPFAPPQNEHDRQNIKQAWSRSERSPSITE